MPRFKINKVVLIVGLAVALATVGVATASNMGFKFVKAYLALPNINTVTLPYFQSQFANADAVWSDLPNLTPGVDEVTRLTTSSLSETWTGSFGAGGSGGTNFALEVGRPLFIKKQSAGNHVIVGSHNPAFSFSLLALPSINPISLPYHATYLDADDVWLDLPNLIPGTTEVFHFTPSNISETWTGSFGSGGAGGTNFPIVIGEAIVVKGTGACASCWVPDHY